MLPTHPLHYLALPAVVMSFGANVPKKHKRADGASSTTPTGAEAADQAGGEQWNEEDGGVARAAEPLGHSTKGRRQ